MPQIIDGKATAAIIKAEIAEEVKALVAEGKKTSASCSRTRGARWGKRDLRKKQSVSL